MKPLKWYRPPGAYVAGIITGNPLDEQALPTRAADFSIWQMSRPFLSWTGDKERFSFVADVHPALHPGHSPVSCAMG